MRPIQWHIPIKLLIEIMPPLPTGGYAKTKNSLYVAKLMTKEITRTKKKNKTLKSNKSIRSCPEIAEQQANILQKFYFQVGTVFT